MRACTTVALVVIVAGPFLIPAGIGRGAEGGDTNGDGNVDIADALYLLQYLFRGGEAPAPGTCAEPRVIFVVRHAEKESGGDDPGLTPEGRERVQRLLAHFTDTELAAIYASEKRRTQETAAPVAEYHHMPVTIYNQISEIHLLIDHVRALPSGASALLVGHSYTIDDILQWLGVEDPPVVSVTDYENLFVVVLPVEPDRETTLVRMRYP